MGERPIFPALVADTRPVIEIAGQDYPMVRQLLLSLEITEQEGGLGELELLVSNATRHAGHGTGFAFENTETALFEIGAPIRVRAGDASSPSAIFEGRISAVIFEMEDGGQPKLRVLAEDGLMEWRMTRRNRTHPAGSLKAMLERLCQGTGLESDVTGLTETVEEEQQLNETDLSFLRRLLERHDADAQVDGSRLCIAKRGEADRGELTLELGSQLRSVRVAADLAGQRALTELSGFDLGAGRPEAAASRSPALGGGRGESGMAIAARVFPQSRDRLCLTSFRNEAEAQELADRAQARRSRQFVTAEGRALGNPALRVGARLVLEGLGPRFSNTYHVIRTRHAFDVANGYHTDFTAECAFLGRGAEA